MKENVKDIDFEASMERLSEITDKLNENKIKLEEALTLYEEAVGLVRECNKKLDDTQRKIKMLRISEDGEPVETELDAETPNSVSDFGK